MKNNKIIYLLKTTGVVATAVLTMASCGHKMSESEKQTVQHKTDSAAMMHPEYKLASDLSDLCDLRIKNLHRLNKDIAKIYARRQVLDNITDTFMKKLMLDMITEESFVTQNCFAVTESDSVQDNVSDAVSFIIKNQSWFNDLMLYLTDEYNEKQFLQSDFFKVIDDEQFRNMFEHNVKKIEKIQSGADFAAERKTVVYQRLWNKYEKEVQKQR